MYKHINILFLLPLWIMALAGHKLIGEPTNYYGIAKVLTFNDTDFKLSWSSHPNDNYYKQEYLPKGEKSEHFKNMLLIDFLKGDMSVKDAVGAQVQFITERKKTDAICNYQVVKNPNADEYVLDFIMSEHEDKHTTLVEWNAYHYKGYTDSLGHKGVLMLGVSHREYDDTMPFMRSLGTYRQDMLKKLRAFPLPEIQLEK